MKINSLPFVIQVSAWVSAFPLIGKMKIVREKIYDIRKRLVKRSPSKCASRYRIINETWINRMKYQEQTSSTSPLASELLKRFKCEKNGVPVPTWRPRKPAVWSTSVLEKFRSRSVGVRKQDRQGRIYVFVTRANTGSDRSLTWIHFQAARRGTPLLWALANRKSGKVFDTVSKNLGPLGLWGKFEGQTFKEKLNWHELLYHRKRGIFTDIHSFLSLCRMERVRTPPPTVREWFTGFHWRRPTSVWPRDPLSKMEREIATPLRHLTNNLDKETRPPVVHFRDPIEMFSNCLGLFDKGRVPCRALLSRSPRPPPTEISLRWNFLDYLSTGDRYVVSTVKDFLVEAFKFL